MYFKNIILEKFDLMMFAISTTTDVLNNQSKEEIADIMCVWSWNTDLVVKMLPLEEGGLLGCGGTRL